MCRCSNTCMECCDKAPYQADVRALENQVLQESKLKGTWRSVLGWAMIKWETQCPQFDSAARCTPLSTHILVLCSQLLSAPNSACYNALRWALVNICASWGYLRVLCRSLSGFENLCVFWTWMFHWNYPFNHQSWNNTYHTSQLCQCLISARFAKFKCLVETTYLTGGYVSQS